MMKTINCILLTISAVSFITACSTKRENISQYNELSGAQCKQTLLEEITGKYRN